MCWAWQSPDSSETTSIKEKLRSCFLGYCLAHYRGKCKPNSLQSATIPPSVKNYVTTQSRGSLPGNIWSHDCPAYGSHSPNWQKKLKYIQVPSWRQKSSQTGSFVTHVCKEQVTVASCRHWPEATNSPIKTRTVLSSCLLLRFELLACFFQFFLKSEDSTVSSLQPQLCIYRLRSGRVNQFRVPTSDVTSTFPSHLKSCHNMKFFLSFSSSKKQMVLAWKGTQTISLWMKVKVCQ